MERLHQLAPNPAHATGGARGCFPAGMGIHSWALFWALGAAPLHRSLGGIQY